MRLFVVLWGSMLLTDLASCDLVELSLVSTCDLFSLSQTYLNCYKLFCLTRNWFSMCFPLQRLENEQKNLEKMELPLPTASKREAFVLVMDLKRKGLSDAFSHEFLDRSRWVIPYPL